MKIVVETVFLSIINLIQCTIDGISYLDDLDSKKLNNEKTKRDDPCNPLYWYPKGIPAYCNFQKIPIAKIAPPPLPTKPVAPPLIIPPQPIPPLVLAPVYPPLLIPPPLTVGPHLLPQNTAVATVGQQSYFPPSYFPQNPLKPLQYEPQRAAMVPGLPGIVTHDGGINILPFSDAYSDLLEKHKQKIIRRKLEKILRYYEDYPTPKRFRRRKRLRDVYFE